MSGYSLWKGVLGISLALSFGSADQAYAKQLGPVSKAKKVVDNIDYLPFSVARDGCYARALYMGMELTIHGVASSNQYVVGKLKPQQGITWRYHVAPLVADRQGSRYYVFDRSLSQKPLTVSQWVRMSKPAKKPEVYIAPVSHYSQKTVSQMSQQKKHGYSYKKRVQSVRQLPEFRIADIANACKTAWKYIGQEKMTQSYKAHKRQALAERTNYLVKRLTQLRKLDPGSRVISCAKGTYGKSFFAGN